jgi:hypothetical protein
LEGASIESRGGQLSSRLLGAAAFSSAAAAAPAGGGDGSKLFDRVLVANRGEIAERVIRTCDRLGIETVALYSTADAQARFVGQATHSYCVGPPPASESYLNVPAVLSVIQESGAQAVHPGYVSFCFVRGPKEGRARQEAATCASLHEFFL